MSRKVRVGSLLRGQCFFEQDMDDVRRSFKVNDHNYDGSVSAISSVDEGGHRGPSYRFAPETLVELVDDTSVVSRRGFAALSPDERRAMATRGARAVHEAGKAYRWTPEQAKAAAKLARERGGCHVWTPDAAKAAGIRSGEVRRQRAGGAS